MGCSASKLDDEEAVQLCKDRKNFIKHAVERRMQFASAHIAYLRSLRRVSIALRNYVEGDEGHDFFYDSCSTPPFDTVKKSSPEIIGIPLEAFPRALPSSDEVPSHMVHYFRSGGNAAVSVEERPRSPETVRLDSYFSMDPYGIDGFYTTMESPVHSSFFSSSPHIRPSYPPQSPPTSQWDSFWNPFSSLDSHGYPSQDSPDQIASDDDVAGLRQAREEEGIPDLEEEGEPTKPKNVEERANLDTNYVGEEASVDCPDKDKVNSDTVKVKGCQSHGADSVEVSQTQNEAELQVSKEQDLMGNGEASEETLGFTVYLNRRPNSMVEVATSIEKQFTRICDSAHEVSVILEASRAQYSLNSHELTASKMLNPIALIRAASLRSASFRSTSSRFFLPSCTSKEDGYETSSDFSEESCMTSGSHQSTLDRLYEWEKKLYKEAKSGERIRIAYEKKCRRLMVNGEEDPSVTGKTGATARDLYAQIKVCVRSLEAISKRIETLRDEELQPQVMELIQGLAGMWRIMADCHHIQKCTIDEAKLLLATTPKVLLATLPIRLSRAAANLESELRNWRSCFKALVAAQRSYVHALLDWLIRCGRAPEDDARLAASSPLSPPRCSGAPPIFELCMQWSRALDRVTEDRALDGLDFFASGIASVAEQQREAEEAARRSTGGGGGTAGAVVAWDEQGGGGFGATAPEKMAEVAVRVLCAGMSVALGAMTEFSAASRDGYEELHAAAASGGRKGGEGERGVDM